MIYEKLTPLEYLEFVAGLWRIDPATAEARARELIGWLGLGPHADERCQGFSRGMRQKVALAMGPDAGSVSVKISTRQKRNAEPHVPCRG